MSPLLIFLTQIKFNELSNNSGQLGIEFLQKLEKYRFDVLLLVLGLGLLLEAIDLVLEQLDLPNNIANLLKKLRTCIMNFSSLSCMSLISSCIFSRLEFSCSFKYLSSSFSFPSLVISAWVSLYLSFSPFFFKN